MTRRAVLRFCHCLPIDFEVQNSNEGSSQGKYQIIKKYLSQHDFDHLFLGAGPPRKRTNSQKSKVSIKGGLNIPNMDPFTLYSIQDSESCCVSPFPYFYFSWISSTLFLQIFLDFWIFFVLFWQFFSGCISWFLRTTSKHFYSENTPLLIKAPSGIEDASGILVKVQFSVIKIILGKHFLFPSLSVLKIGFRCCHRKLLLTQSLEEKIGLTKLFCGE